MRSVPTVGSCPIKHLIAFSFKHSSCLFNIIDRRQPRQVVPDKEDWKLDPIVSIEAKFQELNVYLLHSYYTFVEFVIHLLSILLAAEWENCYWVLNSYRFRDEIHVSKL